MHKSSESARSDWPLSLMLDEIWLRIHRTLVHKLEAASVWPEVGPHNILMRGQKALGERLKSELLSEVLGRIDFACLNSETIFGVANQRFRARLPFVISFGYELGSGFSTLLHGECEHTAEVARICGMFNLGVSMFDLIYDNYPDLFEEFAKTFNERILTRLEDDLWACQDLEIRSKDVLTDELRVLLKIIAWFFSRLHLLSKAVGRSEAWDKLSSLLLEAYRTELHSADATAHAEDDLVKVAQAKSTLPFSIIHQVARLCSAWTHPEVERAIDSVVSHVATTFWLTDDLVDVVPDFQAGDLNVILAQAGIGERQTRELSRNYPVLVRLLEGSYIEEAASRVQSSLVSMVNILQSDNFRNEEAAHFCNVVLSYTRNWME